MKIKQRIYEAEIEAENKEEQLVLSKLWEMLPKEYTDEMGKTNKNYSSESREPNMCYGSIYFDGQTLYFKGY